MARPPTQILLTGRPGVGKTTALVRTAELLAVRGVPTTGFYTEELRRQGRRIGFRGVPLDVGEVAGGALPRGPAVGRPVVPYTAPGRPRALYAWPASDDLVDVLVTEIAGEGGTIGRGDGVS